MSSSIEYEISSHIVLVVLVVAVVIWAIGSKKVAVFLGALFLAFNLVSNGGTIWQIINHKAPLIDLFSPAAGGAVQGVKHAQNNYQNCKKGKDLVGQTKCDYKLGFSQAYDAIDSVLNLWPLSLVKCQLVTCDKTKSKPVSPR